MESGKISPKQQTPAASNSNVRLFFTRNIFFMYLLLARKAKSVPIRVLLKNINLAAPVVIYGSKSSFIFSFVNAHYPVTVASIQIVLAGREPRNNGYPIFCRTRQFWVGAGHLN